MKARDGLTILMWRWILQIQIRQKESGRLLKAKVETDQSNFSAIHCIFRWTYSCVQPKTWLLFGLMVFGNWNFAVSQKIDAFSEITIDSLLKSTHDNVKLDAPRKSQIADSLFQVSSQLRLPCQQTHSKIEQSFSLDEMGLADSALVQLLWANTTLKPQCGPELKWMLYCGLTNVYLTLGEYGKVDSLANIAQLQWHASDSEPKWYFSILTNSAIATASNGDPDNSIKLLFKILSEARQVKDQKFIQKTLINIATVKGIMEDSDSAYHYLMLAAANMDSTSDVDAYMVLQQNLAIMDINEGRFALAKSRLDTVDALAAKFNNLEIRANILFNRAYIAEDQKDFKNAYGFLHGYIILHDSLLNQERVKAVTEMQEKYESEKKARQIQKLELENLDAALQNERVRTARNRYIFLGGGLFLLAIGIYSRLHFVRKSKKAIQHEKDISEGLLLNILPASVADELKIKGHADAQHFELATILFSDFKDFTNIASELTPSELVTEINICFRAFDEIMVRLGIEKIKTIGDAYMAAGAIPGTNTAKPDDVVQAGLDMQEFIIARAKERTAQDLPAFEMRIGIHSGPVVAGIVGVKNSNTISGAIQSTLPAGWKQTVRSTGSISQTRPIS